jgi:hypothetical protein
MNVDQMTQGFSPLVDGMVVAEASIPSDRIADFVHCPVMLDGFERATDATSSGAGADFSLPIRDAHAHSTAARQSRRQADSRVSKGQSRPSASDIYFLIASDYRYSDR